MSKDIRKLKDKASTYLGRGKLKKAAKLYQKIVQAEPSDLHSRQRLADTLARLGDKEGAIREYQHVAGRYAADGLFLKAVAIAKLIRSIDPERTETEEALALLYARQQERDQERRARMLPAAMAGALQATNDEQVDTAPSAEDSRVWAAAPVIERLDALPTEVEAEPEAPGHGEEPEEEEVEEGLDLVVDDRELSATEIDPSTLPKIPLFSDMSARELEAVLDRLTLRWTSAGEDVVTEGEPGRSMFVIIEGKFDVIREARGDEPRVVATLGPGTFFGEMALVTDAPRIATVRSQGEGLLLELDRQTLSELSREHPNLADVVDEYVLSRLIENLMRSSEVFRAFPDDARRHFVGRCRVLSVPAGRVLLRQGGTNQGVYVVLRGRLSVVRQTPSGGEERYPDMKEGDMVGEISTIRDGEATATVRAEVDSVVLHIPSSAFMMLFTLFPRVREHLTTLMEERLKRTEQMDDEARRQATDRLAPSVL